MKVNWQFAGRPPFCCQNIFKPNRIMTAVINIINSLFKMIVAWHWLNALETCPLSINFVICCVLCHFVEDPTSAHVFYHVLIILLAINEKLHSINWVFVGLCIPEGFIFHIIFNLLARHMLWQISPCMFDQWLPINSSTMKCKNSSSNTKATMHCHYFASVVDWLCHVEHERRSLGVELKFCQVSRLFVAVNWAVLLLLQLDPPHHQLALVAISNGMIFVASWLWHPWYKHEAWKILVQPQAHAFTKTKYPKECDSPCSAH